MGTCLCRLPGSLPAILWNIFSRTTEAAISWWSPWKLEENVPKPSSPRMQTLLVEVQPTLKSTARSGSKLHTRIQLKVFHAIRRNYVVSLCLTASTHTHIKSVDNWKLKEHISLDLQLQFVTEILCNKALVSITLQWLIIFYGFM